MPSIRSAATCATGTRFIMATIRCSPGGMRNLTRVLMKRSRFTRRFSANAWLACAALRLKVNNLVSVLALAQVVLAGAEEAGARVAPVFSGQQLHDLATPVTLS